MPVSSGLLAPVTDGILVVTTPPIPRVLLPCELDTLSIKMCSLCSLPLDLASLCLINEQKVVEGMLCIFWG